MLRIGLLASVAATALVFPVGSRLGNSANAAGPTPTPSVNSYDGEWQLDDSGATSGGFYAGANWIPLPEKMTVVGGKASGPVNSTTAHPGCSTQEQGDLSGTLNSDGRLTASMVLREAVPEFGAACGVPGTSRTINIGGQVHADGTLIVDGGSSSTGGVFRLASPANRKATEQFPYDGLWHTTGRLVTTLADASAEWKPEAWILFPTDISIVEGVVSGRASGTRPVRPIQAWEPINGASLLTGPCDVTQTVTLTGTVSATSGLIATYSAIQTLSGAGCGPAQESWHYSGEKVRYVRGWFEGDAIRVRIGARDRGPDGVGDPTDGTLIGEWYNDEDEGLMQRGAVAILPWGGAVLPGVSGAVADLFGPDGVSGPIPAALLGGLAGLLAAYLGLSASTMPTLFAPFGLSDGDPWDPLRSLPGPDGVPGQPGWVWYGRWMPPDEARNLIAQDQAREARDQAEADQSREAWLQGARDRDAASVQQRLQDEADARARAAEQDRAARQLDAARQTALDMGDEQMWQDLLKDFHRPDGTLDPVVMARLKGVLVDRIARGVGDTEPQTTVLDDALRGTIDDLRHSLIVRMGADLASGGTSEMLFLTQSALDAMNRASAQALANGGDLTATDAFLSGIGGAARDLFPVTTRVVDILGSPPSGSQVPPGLQGALRHIDSRGGDESPASDVGQGEQRVSDVPQLDPPPGEPSVDAGSATSPATDQHGDPHEPRSSTAEPQAPADNAVPPADEPTRTPGGFRIEGNPFPPKEAGISDDHANIMQDEANKLGLRPQLRPCGENTLDRIAEGDLPKPEWLKIKTANDDDALLGAPYDQVGRVVIFEPKPLTDAQIQELARTPYNPDATGLDAIKQKYRNMDAGDIAAINQRYVDRMKEQRDFGPVLRARNSSGDIDILPGGEVVIGGTKTHYTSDIDIFAVNNVDGTPASPEKVKAFIAACQAREVPITHGDHVSWVPDALGPHGDADSAIKDRILGVHEPPIDPNQAQGALDAVLDPRGKGLMQLNPSGDGWIVGFNRTQPLDR